MYHYTRSICYSYITRVQLLIMQSVVIITINYKNTENWEDLSYQNRSPPKIGGTGLILAEKLVPPDHFCCQYWSGQIDFGSQIGPPLLKSIPTKVAVLVIATIHIIGCCIVTYVSHDKGYIKLIIYVYSQLICI